MSKESFDAATNPNDAGENLPAIKLLQVIKLVGYYLAKR